VGAGCFVAAAMSAVNSGPGHRQMSGFFMALMNAGLVIGLVAAGWLATDHANPAAGILLFSLCALLPASISFFIRESPRIPSDAGPAIIRLYLRDYRRLWYSAVILIGVTGVVTSLYPKFSGASPDIVGIWIAGMSCATIAAVLVASGITIPSYQVIRISAVLMAAGVIVTIVSPWGFVILGGLAGFVMIAQMAVLARAQDHQGVVMGLYSTAGYLGMTVLPFLAGFLADMTGFLSAFCVTALLAATAAVAIGTDPSGRVEPREE